VLRGPSAIAEPLVIIYICCFIISDNIFLALRLGRAIMHHHTKILLKQLKMIVEISCFYIFQMAIGRHVEFLKA